MPEITHFDSFYSGELIMCTDGYVIEMDRNNLPSYNKGNNNTSYRAIETYITCFNLKNMSNQTLDVYSY